MLQKPCGERFDLTGESIEVEGKEGES